MKRILSVGMLSIVMLTVTGQKTKQQYPTPEYNNEIYFFIKDSAQVTRLEKGFSKMESKSKMGGIGGAENGYELEGSKSPVRLEAGPNLSFIFFTGEESNSTVSDSMMKKNGIDPAAFGDPMAMMNDPSRTTSLYKMSSEKGSRKITMQSYQGMKLLGGSKKESTKYTLSVKKIRSGYYELQVDKPLLRGEYAFMIMDMASMTGSTSLFAFGID